MRKSAGRAENTSMERCEGYYRLENRRCDRSSLHEVRASDGAYYVVCEYHARQAWSASVARWHGDSDVRAAPPAGLRAGIQPAA